MQKLPVRNIGKYGLNTDTPPYDLPLEGFDTVLNCVFRHGKMQKVPGWIPTDFGSGTDPGFDMLWFDTWNSGGIIRSALFGDTQIRIWDGSTLSTATVSPPITALGDKKWITERYSAHLIATNNVDDPYVTTDQGANWGTLPGWTDAANGAPDTTCKVIRAHKNYLFALGIDGQPYTVYMSDVGKLGDMPTNWATTDPGSFAVAFDLQAADGPIVDAAELGDYLIIYTELAAYAISVTGNVANPVNVRRLFSWGLATQECVVQYENLHFCVDERVIYVHDGTNVRRIGDNKIERLFYDQILQNAESIKVARNLYEHEILVYFRAKGGEDPDALTANSILTWNWLEDIWTFEDPGVDIQCIKVAQIPSSVTTWQDLIDDSVTWQDLINNGTSWADLSTAGDRLAPFQLELRKWSEREIGTTRDGVEYHAYAERNYIDLDEVTGDAVSIKELQTLVPQVSGSSSVGLYFEVGCTDRPNGTIMWSGPVLFDLGNDDYKVDFRAAGRYLSWRAGSWTGVGDPVPGSWEMSGADFDFIVEGPR